MDEFCTKVERTVSTYRLVTPGARIVIGVSGGADSVALAHALSRMEPTWRLKLHIAHLDHGIRKDSFRDAAFVEELASRWNIGCSVQRLDVSKICKQKRWSLEDGARRLRYQFLIEVARRQSAGYLALGHTADDQAETVLMRIIRGTGLTGLSAIPVKRKLEEIWIVRPLLEVRRGEILSYLQEKRLSFHEDSTNADVRFTRNRIRHELLPLLERNYNPGIKGALTQLAEQSGWDYAYLQEAAQRQWKRMAKVRPRIGRSGASVSRINGSPKSGGSEFEVAIALAPFRRQPRALQRQLVRRAIQYVRGDLNQFEYRHWVEVERLFGERPVGTCVDLPGGVQLRRERERVLCGCLCKDKRGIPVE